MIESPDLSLDPATGLYSDGKQHYARVTRVIQEAGLYDASNYPPGAARRGTAVHLACQFLDEGDLDEDSIPPEVEGYLHAYRTFLYERPGDWVWTGIEKRMAHKTLGYAGTVDRSTGGLVLDIKSGQPEDWHSIQLAGYLGMFEKPMAMARWILYLRADGTYSLKNLPRTEFPRDWAVFQSCLNIYNWKQRRNGSL